MLGTYILNPPRVKAGKITRISYDYGNEDAPKIAHVDATVSISLNKSVADHTHVGDYLVFDGDLITVYSPEDFRDMFTQIQ